MTHDIKHPEKCPLVDELHTYLWKLFPMDRFVFIECSEVSAPEYSGTNLPSESGMTEFTGETCTVLFTDEVNEAVEAFLNKRNVGKEKAHAITLEPRSVRELESSVSCRIPVVVAKHAAKRPAAVA